MQIGRRIGFYQIKRGGGGIQPSPDPSVNVQTIQQAIDAAALESPVGTVYLAEGEFGINNQLSVHSGVELIGSGMEDTVIKQTLTKSSTVSRCFLITDGSAVAGMTVSNGIVSSNTAGPGAGAKIVNGSMSWCRITNNKLEGNAGNENSAGVAVSFANGQGSLDHCIIDNNDLVGFNSRGTAVGSWENTGPIYLDVCLIHHNKHSGYGSGTVAFSVPKYDIYIRNCTIADNNAKINSGGIYLYGEGVSGADGKLVMINDIIFRNMLTGTSTERNFNGACVPDDTRSTNCLVSLDSENRKVGSTYPKVPNSITASPRFVDHTTDNYHYYLYSPVQYSGVIYEGLNTDLDNIPFGSTPSMGCYQTPVTPVKGIIHPSGDTTGENDMSYIQSRIDMAGTESPVEDIELDEGQFYLDFNLSATNGVLVKGQGYKDTILRSVCTTPGYNTRLIDIYDGSILSGVTLTEGKTNSAWANGSGAGAYLKNGNITHCCISGNTTAYNNAGNNIWGCAVCMYDGKGTIDHTIIANNLGKSSSGACMGGGIGIYNPSGKILIDTCLIYGNKIPDGGAGGIAAYTGNNHFGVTIQNCTIVNNEVSSSSTSSKGSGGIYIQQYSPKTSADTTLLNNIIVDNSSASRGDNNIVIDTNYQSVIDMLKQQAYNNMWANGTSAFGNNSINIDGSAASQFLNETSANYHLAMGSLAISSGVYYSGIEKDLDDVDFENPPSRGCYEYDRDDIPLYFVANTAGSTVGLTSVNGSIDVHLTYSTDGMQTWSSTDWNGNPITLANAGDRVYIKASQDNPNGMRNSGTNYHTFKMTGSVSAGGRIKYLLAGDGSREDVPRMAFQQLFKNCTSLTKSLELPATTIADNCYNGMFDGCTNLIEGPLELPSKKLYDYCYQGMFQNCTSLTSIPSVLPATTLAVGCYGNMFKNCSSLTCAPEIKALIAAYNSCSYMFADCSKLSSAPELPAVSLGSLSYANMFSGCKAMTNGPSILPATTLQGNCYTGMFNNCTNLTSAPELPATTLSDRCYQYMFQNCTSLTNAPVLASTTPVNGCYYAMFNGCLKLKISENGGVGTKIMEIPSGTTTGSDWNTNMFKNTAGTFKGTPSIGNAYYCYQ